METKTVLIVDDEPDLLATLQFRVEQEGFAVRVARDGLAALEQVRADPPDLIVLDVMLPGENGYRVSKSIREDEEKGLLPHIPIILLTARNLSSDPEREAMFLDFSAADEMLYKPYDTVELLGHIHRLIEG
jgi:DNA-binding response OmpR family regulator